MSDMVAKLVMDIQDWVEPIMDAKSHLADIEGVTKKSVSSIRQSFAGLSSAKQFLATQLQKVDSGETPYRVLLGSIRELNQAWGGETVEAARKAITANTTVSDSHNRLSASTNSFRDSLNPLLDGLGKKAVVAALLYKIGLDEILSASRKHLTANSEFRKSVGGLWDSIRGLAGTIINEYTSGVKAALMALVGASTGFDSFTEMVDYGAKVLTNWAKTSTVAINQVKKDVRDAGLVFATALVIFQEGPGGADKFYEQGQALQVMAEQTEKVIKKQEQMRDVLGYIKASAKAAGDAQKQAAEITKIGTIDNLQELEKVEEAFKLRNMGVSKDIADSKQWKQSVDQVTAAIEKQRTAITTGTLKKPESEIDKQLAAARKAVAEFGMTDTQKALAAATAGQGATAEKVNALRRELELRDKLVSAAELQKATEQAAAEATQQAAARWQQGQSRIDSMRDQLDLLTGAATEADIAMRELTREGFDEQQVAEIGALTDELAKLKEGKKTTGREGENSAALEGSSQAAELILKGTATNNPNKKLEQLMQQSVTIQAQIASRDPVEFDFEEVTV